MLLDWVFVKFAAKIQKNLHMSKFFCIFARFLLKSTHEEYCIYH